MFEFKIARDIGRFVSSRRSGSELRRKILSVLSSGEDCVILDFADVVSVSGSFSDEVLGVLVKARGEAWVRQRVKLANVDDWTQRAIEGVIRERVDATPVSGDSHAPPCA